MKRALILSGGGARGAFQIGVWRYLQRQGWDPDLICGTSVGAINAAAIGSGMRLNELADIWKTHHRSKMYRLQFLRLAACMLLGRPFRSVVDTSPLRSVITRYLDVAALRRSRREIVITAVNLNTARLALFDQHVIDVDHIMAASAMPVLFPWQTIQGQPYWDGAVAANTPLLPALQRGATEIVVVLLSPVAHTPQPAAPTLTAAMEQSLEHFLIGSYQTTLMDHGLPPYANQGPVRIAAVAPTRMLGLRSLVNFSIPQAVRLMEEGYRNARVQLRDFFHHRPLAGTDSGRSAQARNANEPPTPRHPSRDKVTP